MTGLRGLVFLLAVCLAACGANVTEEGCDDMTRIPIGPGTPNNEAAWGQSKKMLRPWVEGQVRSLVQKPPARLVVPDPTARNGVAVRHCVPQAQSVLLVALGAADPAAGGVFRWVVEVGAGGARSTVKLDALNIQQLSVAGENIQVSVVCEKQDPFGVYTAPAVDPTFSATLADGNVSSGLATYTQRSRVAPLSVDLVFPIPAMATSFRVGGPQGTANDPFVAGVIAFTASYQIWQLQNLATLHNSSGFIPLNGLAQSLTFRNANAVAVDIVVQWGLDL